MVHLSHAKKSYVWGASVVAGFIMLAAGLPKIWGSQDWTQNFHLWGYPDEMRIFVGLVEVTGALLLFVPRTSLFAAGALGVIMAGAMYTQFMHGDFGDWIIPLVLFLTLGSIVAIRWPHPTQETGKLNEPVEEDTDDSESPVAAR